MFIFNNNTNKYNPKPFIHMFKLKKTNKIQNNNYVIEISEWNKIQEFNFIVLFILFVHNESVRMTSVFIENITNILTEMMW